MIREIRQILVILVFIITKNDKVPDPGRSVLPFSEKGLL
jgi:hypothetical protein